jgi:uncharacterized protein (TIGR00251 family)
MRISVKVIPRAAKNGMECITKGEYRIRLTAPPVDDKANRLLFKLIAKHFGVTPSSIHIVAGGNSRRKIIELP